MTETSNPENANHTYLALAKARIQLLDSQGYPPFVTAELQTLSSDLFEKFCKDRNSWCASKVASDPNTQVVWTENKAKWQKVGLTEPSPQECLDYSTTWCSTHIPRFTEFERHTKAEIACALVIECNHIEFNYRDQEAQSRLQTYREVARQRGESENCDWLTKHRHDYEARRHQYLDLILQQNRKMLELINQAQET